MFSRSVFFAPRFRERSLRPARLVRDAVLKLNLNLNFAVIVLCPRRNIPYGFNEWTCSYRCSSYLLS